MSTAMDQISYADLYARRERPTGGPQIELSSDREHRHGTFSELERRPCRPPSVASAA